jgi:DNA-binding transcriptional ArsR family regulator
MGNLLKTERGKGAVGRKEMKPPTGRVELLSKELVVAREIYAATRIEKGGPVYFNLLVDRLQAKKLASRATVSKALDMLFDQGVVRADWATNRDGKHVRALRIAGEAENFVRSIYKHTS